MTKIVCERMDCKHWVDNECSKKKIEIKEKTTSSKEELAICNSYEIVSAFC